MAWIPKFFLKKFFLKKLFSRENSQLMKKLCFSLMQVQFYFKDKLRLTALIMTD